jgi:hypothetical protein
MGRSITKDKYHNNRDDVEKKRKKNIEEIQLEIDVLREDIFQQTALLEEELERNSDPPLLLKRQKETTMNLEQDCNKILTDVTVAENRIKDLETR